MEGLLSFFLLIVYLKIQHNNNILIDKKNPPSGVYLEGLTFLHSVFIICSDYKSFSRCGVWLLLLNQMLCFCGYEQFFLKFCMLVLSDGIIVHSKPIRDMV